MNKPHGRRPGQTGTAPGGEPGGTRPLPVAGIVGAVWCVGIGLAVLTTVTLVGWIAAPRTALGPGLPGVFRTAVNFWLVAHHAGFSLAGGRVGLLPLGLTLLPAALLHRGGGWLVRVAEVTGPRRVRVVHLAVALAAPYGLLAGLLALVARSEVVQPSAWQSLFVGFLLALVAGGLGAARGLVRTPGRRVRSGLGALLRLLPDRPRSLVVGTAGATAVLLASGAVLVAVALAASLSDAMEMYAGLAPGVVGAVLLFLVELAFLPNAVIWGMSYAVGPGFSVGAGTSVSPTGVFLDTVPVFPPLAALPSPGPAPLVSLVALAAPFAAGAVGGVLTVRAMPSPTFEAAPLWGFVSGVLTGGVAAVLAALSGGPLGGGRLTTMGPSPWQVGLLATLEVGVAAAVAAWAANWSLLRGTPAAARAGAQSGQSGQSGRVGGSTSRKGRRARTHPEAGAGVAATDRVAAGGGASAATQASHAAPGPGAAPAQDADEMAFVEPEPVLGARRARPARERAEHRSSAIYVLKNQPNAPSEPPESP